MKKTMSLILVLVIALVCLAAPAHAAVSAGNKVTYVTCPTCGKKMTEQQYARHQCSQVVSTYTLTITYVDGEGNEMATTYTAGELVEGTTYNVSSPAVAGYTPDIATVTGTMPAANVDVVVVYSPNEYPLNITYVMSDGNNEVKPADVVNQMYFWSAAYNVASPEIVGYKVDIATVEGTMDDVNGKSYIVTYSPIAYTLAINYVDVNGATLAPSVSDKLAYNVNYSVPSPAIEGYTLVDGTQATISGTMPANDVVVDVVYAPITYTITVNYVYSDGTTAADTYTEVFGVGAKYSVDSPVITGYTPDITNITGVVTGNREYTVVYTAVPVAPAEPETETPAPETEPETEPEPVPAPAPENIPTSSVIEGGNAGGGASDGSGKIGGGSSRTGGKVARPKTVEATETPAAEKPATVEPEREEAVLGESEKIPYTGSSSAIAAIAALAAATGMAVITLRKKEESPMFFFE